MTIGYVLDDTLDRNDGVQQAMITIAERMRSLGHEVHYIVADTKRTDLQNVHSVGSFFSLSFNGNSVRTPKPASKKDIQRALSAINIDVLHVQMPYSPFLAGRVISAARSKVPVFGTFHILPYNKRASISAFLLGFMLRKQLMQFEKCYAVSQPARIFMERTFRCSGEVLPNPVNWSFFHSRKEVRTQKRTIVYVGRFEERKGVRELVYAYAALPESIRESSQLILCGHGPLWDDIKRLIQKLNLDVAMPGYVSEEQKADFLKNAFIAVFPSKGGESFGIVLIEAMSAGARVTIGGDNPGYSSVLHPWPEALFDPKDHRQFTKVLRRFLEEYPLGGRIGREQHLASHEYDVDVVVNRLERDYEVALEERKIGKRLKVWNGYELANRD